MFTASVEVIEVDRVLRYCLLKAGTVLSYASVLDAWQTDQAFRHFFTALLKDAPFSGYRWETPAMTATTGDRSFAFVLINTPSFASRKTDAQTFARYFTDDDRENGIVAFPNLGGDARLIVPSPRTSDSAYGHLAAFVRSAPHAQVDALWRVIGHQVQSQISTKPLWLSSAGGDVAWLHVRMDSRPKYYGYAPFKTV